MPTSGGNSASGRRCKYVFSAKHPRRSLLTPLDVTGSLTNPLKNVQKNPDRGRGIARGPDLTRMVFGVPNHPENRSLISRAERKPQMDTDQHRFSHTKRFTLPVLRSSIWAAGQAAWRTAEGGRVILSSFATCSYLRASASIGGFDCF